MHPTAHDDPPPPLAQGQPLHPITTAPPATHSYQDQDTPYHPWVQLAPSYPYRSPLPLDSVSSDSTMGPFIEAQVEISQETSPHLLLEAPTTHRFPSTHPHHPLPPQRRSPPMVGQQQQQQQQPQRPSPILVSDPTQDPTTTTTSQTTLDHTVSEEMYARIALAGGQVPLGPQHMTTGQSLDPSLDGSPLWNSAMTPMMNQQLDHLYHYQAQRQHSAPLAQPHPQDLYPQHRNSLSTTGRHPPSPPHPHQQQQQHRQGQSVSPPQRQASIPRYSQDLHRQQEEQFRRMQLEQQQQQVAVEQQYQEEQRERLRRRSEEDLDLLRMSIREPFHHVDPSMFMLGDSHRLRPHGHPYYPAQAQQVYGGEMGLHDGDLDRLALDMDGQGVFPRPVGPQEAYPPLLHQVALPPETLKYESPLE